MMGKAVQAGGRLFYVGVSLEERIPVEHPLRKVARAVDFGFVRSRVAGLYGVNGHESVDPALILKLLFLVFFEKVRSERELMRQLPLRLDWLWFCGLDLDSKIPDHSVLSKARGRWGLVVFEEVFSHVLKLCVEAGLVDGQTVYADSTTLRADASVESRVPRVLWNQLEAGLKDEAGLDRDRPRDPDRTPPPPEDGQAVLLPPSRNPQIQQRPEKFNARYVGKTDPDATTTSRRGRRVTLAYKDHCLVDDRCGIITATIATAADYDDATMLTTLLDQHRDRLGVQPERAVADSAYGTRANYQALPERGIEPYLKPRSSVPGSGGWLDRMPAACDRSTARRLLKRRLYRSEGRFAEAHVWHDHRRCRWRRRWRVQVQCYLVALVQNIKKLAKTLHARITGPALAQGLRPRSAARLYA